MGTNTSQVESELETPVDILPILTPSVDSATDTTTTEPSENDTEEKYCADVIMVFELYKSTLFSYRLQPKTFSKSGRNKVHMDAMEEALEQIISTRQDISWSDLKALTYAAAITLASTVATK